MCARPLPGLSICSPFCSWPTQKASEQSTLAGLCPGVCVVCLDVFPLVPQVAPYPKYRLGTLRDAVAKAQRFGYGIVPMAGPDHVQHFLLHLC